MNALACETCRAALVGYADVARASAQTEVAEHLDACLECRRFAAALRTGEQAWLEEDGARFARGVLARTSAAEALVSELRELAEMDPGPGFTERVLLHTSRRPAAARWRANVLAGWRALVRRPRFAWEVAYVATLCWVLIFGNPVTAWEWGSQKVGTIAQQRLGRTASGLRQDLETWRASLAPDVPPGTPDVAPDRPEQTSAFDRAWQPVSDWVRSRLGGVVDAVIGIWQRLEEWISGPAPADPPVRSGEPNGNGARSTQ